MNSKYFFGTLLFLSLISFAMQLGAAIHLIAGLGRPAAGFPERYVYISLYNHEISPSGHIAFTGVAAFDQESSSGVSDETNAIWTGLPGQLRLVIKQNDSIAGFPAHVLFGDFYHQSWLKLTHSGSVGFLASFKISDTEYAKGLVEHIDGKNYGVMKTGDPAPGLSDGETIGDIVDFAFSDAGMVIVAKVAPTGDHKIWFKNNLGLQPIPSPVAGCIYDRVEMNPVSINQSGEFVFLAELYAEDGICSIRFGLFKGRDGVIKTLLAENDPVPGMPGIHFSGFGNPTINDHGSVFFSASMSDNSQSKDSVWVMDDLHRVNPLVFGGEILADKRSDAIVGLSDMTGYDFSNNNLAIVPIASTSGGSALLTGKPRETLPFTSLGDTEISQLGIIAFENEQPPGFGSDWIFNGVFSTLEINQNGQYFFSGIAETVSGGGEVPAIWRGEPDGRTRLVAQEGMKVTVNGEEQTLERIITGGFPTGLSSKRNWLSDNGDIIFLGSLHRRRSDDIFLITDDSKEQKIFNLAEQLFPQYFSPPNVDDQLLEGFVYRHYPDTKTYIGIKNGEVFVLGDVFGSGPQRIDTIENTLRFLEEKTTGS